MDDCRLYNDILHQSAPAAEEDLRDENLPISWPNLIHVISASYVYLQSDWKEMEGDDH